MSLREDYWRKLMAQTVRDELQELRKREKVLVQILEEYERGNPEPKRDHNSNVA